MQSPLKYQTRCVSAFPNKQGYLVGSIEGRVAVNHVEDSLAGGLLRTTTRPTLNLLLLLRACVSNHPEGKSGSDAGPGACCQ